MASVFLSYARDDAKKARPIALALEAAGHSVWWDLHVRGGAQFSKVIEEALKAADVVLVLWSADAIESPWVRDEAAAGRDSGRLVPATIDGTEPPLGFRQFQTIDLSRWKGRGRSAELEELKAAVDTFADSKRDPISAKATRSRRALGGPLLFGLGALVIVALAVGLFILRPWSRFGSSITTVTIAASDDTPSSRAAARDLIVKLGALQTSQLGSIRLAGADEKRGDSDLRMEVGVAPGNPANHASLILKDGSRGTILWSRGFEQPSQQLEDLKQQLAFTSATTLECLLDQRSSGTRLSPEAATSYLNACAQLSEFLNSDPTAAVRMLSAVVQQAPGFKRAWAKLLLAERETTGVAFNGGRPPALALSAFRKHIAEAKRLDPRMPEVTLAEASLLEASDLPGALALIEPLASRHSDDPYVLAAYANVLGKVGRLGDQAEAASKAVRLDPLSPSLRNDFISALAYAGAFDAAQRELREAERLWPGTATVQDARFRFHLRYGDPKIARAIFEQQTDSTGGRAIQLFLDARIEPTRANIQAVLDRVRERLANMENPSAGIGFAVQAYAQFAGKEQVLNLLLNWPKTSDLILLSDVYFRPHLRDTRRDPRFMRVAQRIGLIKYWQQSGRWPDFCFEPGMPYDCKAEAAKLK
jgi:tetratricopeptide (TPR) repeat protein